MDSELPFKKRTPEALEDSPLIQSNRISSDYDLDENFYNCHLHSGMTARDSKSLLDELFPKEVEESYNVQSQSSQTNFDYYRFRNLGGYPSQNPILSDLKTIITQPFPTNQIDKLEVNNASALNLQIIPQTSVATNMHNFYGNKLDQCNFRPYLLTQNARFLSKNCMHQNQEINTMLTYPPVTSFQNDFGASVGDWDERVHNSLTPGPLPLTQNARSLSNNHMHQNQEINTRLTQPPAASFQNDTGASLDAWGKIVHNPFALAPLPLTQDTRSLSNNYKHQSQEANTELAYSRLRLQNDAGASVVDWDEGVHSPLDLGTLPLIQNAGFPLNNYMHQNQEIHTGLTHSLVASFQNDTGASVENWDDRVHSPLALEPLPLIQNAGFPPNNYMHQNQEIHTGLTHSLVSSFQNDTVDNWYVGPQSPLALEPL